jgi:hypothetical protein
MPDESNVVLPQLEEVAGYFSDCQIQAFNLLGYPLKFLGRFAVRSLSTGVCRVDRGIMRAAPRMALMAANFNAIFTR